MLLISLKIRLASYSPRPFHRRKISRTLEHVQNNCQKHVQGSVGTACTREFSMGTTYKQSVTYWLIQQLYKPVPIDPPIRSGNHLALTRISEVESGSRSLEVLLQCVWAGCSGTAVTKCKQTKTNITPIVWIWRRRLSTLRKRSSAQSFFNECSKLESTIYDWRISTNDT